MRSAVSIEVSISRCLISVELSDNGANSAGAAPSISYNESYREQHYLFIILLFIIIVNALIGSQLNRQLIAKAHVKLINTIVESLQTTKMTI